MTSYEDKGAKPSYGSMYGFDHIHWWVGNAKMVADWYVLRMGFEEVAYRGLETGHRNACTHVVRQGRICFAFSSPLLPDSKPELGQDMGEHMSKHGDGVKDVAFQVENAREMFDQAVKRGAKVIREPFEEEDEDGKVVMATVATYGDTVHTFVQRDGYKGVFLPNYRKVEKSDPVAALLKPIGLDYIDHCVGNMPDQGMLPTVEYYEKIMQFHRFWSVDDKQIHTEYSSLRSIVMASYEETIKMPINEPAKGKRKSQIQEYVEYYGGQGVQHIALNTRDILSAITNLRARGVDLLKVPETYYVSLKERLDKAGMKLNEDMKDIQALNILVDFDEKGYLLQLFTKPLMDRPTVFLEVIQREGNEGFGAGNFKSLFEAIEREQDARGNLTIDDEGAGAAAGGAGEAAAAGAGK